MNAVAAKAFFFGNGKLAALHAAKKAQPQLDVAIFVDWHRAQRGLIGKAKSAGNAALPADWRPGGEAIIPPSIPNEKAKDLFPQGWEEVRPYLRKVKLSA